MPEFWMTDAGGVPRKAKQVWMTDASGTPRKAKEIWMTDTSGVPRKVYAGTGTPALNNHSVGPDGVGASFSFNNDGTLVLGTSDGGNVTVSGEWLSNSPSAELTAVTGLYDVQFTYVSGPNTTTGTVNGGRAIKTGAAYGVWLNLAAAQGIGVTGVSGTITGTSPSATLVVDVAIRLTSSGATVASGRFTLNIAAS